MWPDRVSNPGPLTYESGAPPTALCAPVQYLVLLQDTIILLMNGHSFIVKKKNSHSLIAVGAVGVRVLLYLGTADERRSPSLSFRCLSIVLKLYTKLQGHQQC